MPLCPARKTLIKSYSLKVSILYPWDKSKESFFAFSRSAFTISAHSSLAEISGFNFLSNFFAFEGSPIRDSTSDGLKYLLSTLTITSPSLKSLK